ncbi:metal ABC transporter ATP-binding protein [Thiomicrorhabdus sp. Milos-T2]|uniref:ATP-binding cassette domain-containing protein n=1 Tax=Thiomicrorhabdus sp. Milos-T2 TaxID=90814 RepID=UPI00068EB1D7|nr:metal ABC transporter ATP-binding protein [Thiomicrorhabdus sp. Milos-T2]
MHFSNFRQPLIKAENVSHKYETNTVLQNISLQIFAKEIVTLIGPNGAGKSTLLKILLGLTTPSQGTVSRQKNLKIGFMPQKIHIDPTLPMTVERFLQLGLPNKHQTLFSKFKLGSFKAAYGNTIIEKTTQELDIVNLLKQPIQKVSGGEMQRILLARALIREPDLLVLDEPVQGVDLQGQTEIYDYINKIRNEHECGILMVSHDLHIVMKHTDEVLCLNRHMCCTGHPQTVSKNSEFQALFGDLSESLAVYEHHHNESCQLTHGEASHGLSAQNKHHEHQINTTSKPKGGK